MNILVDVYVNLMEAFDLADGEDNERAMEIIDHLQIILRDKLSVQELEQAISRRRAQLSGEPHT